MPAPGTWGERGGEARGEARPCALRARGRSGPDGVAGNRQPLETRPPSREAAQDPKVRAGWGVGGRSRLPVPAESPCLFLPRLSLAPHRSSCEVALAGTKGGAVQQLGSERTTRLFPFSKVSSTARKRGKALVQKTVLSFSTEVSRSHCFLSWLACPLPLRFTQICSFSRVQSPE